MRCHGMGARSSPLSGTFDFGQGDVKIQHRYNVWILGQGIDVTFVRNPPTADRGPGTLQLHRCRRRGRPRHDDSRRRLAPPHVRRPRFRQLRQRHRGAGQDHQEPGPGHRLRRQGPARPARLAVARPHRPRLRNYRLRPLRDRIPLCRNSQVINCIAYGNGESGVNIASQSDTERKARHNTVSGGHYYAPMRSTASRSGAATSTRSPA